ncbi:MAG: hypothetical protein ISN64_01665 [Rickettsia sp.]|nr:hypothetical protein [Rickettsia sp.]
MRADFLEFVVQKLIEETSPKEALYICIQSIPFFGRYETTYEYDFARYVMIPLLENELSKKEMANGFDDVILYPSVGYQNHRDIVEIEQVKEFLLRDRLLEKESTPLNGDHITI